MADKSAVMFLLRHLYEHTDEEHPVSSVELQETLRENGYASDKRTIRKDAEMLRDAGFDVFITEKNGIPTSYFYGSRDWDKYELRILIDAVSSAQFITPEKSRHIISKLAVLSGKQNKADLTPSVFVSEHVKARENKILYVIEKVASAIREKKKISFRYHNYDVNKQRIYRHGGETYVLSPYATIWKEDRYYVVGWSDKRNDIVRFRIDRMPVPRILKDDAVPPPETFNIQDYADKFTRMYGGREETVSLRCRPEMIDTIIDRFGLDVEITNVTTDGFTATAPVAVGGTFLAWVFQFAGQMYIQSPECVRDLYSKMLQTAQHGMSAGQFSEVDENTWKL